MTDAPDMTPFGVDISRMIELLAAQIYPTPFALLRENVQNSFDAILMRLKLGDHFEPSIDVTIEPSLIRVVDNGIGMTRAELGQHFWRAGSSSKNTDEARAAGVVGTFGIGAMANFGIAEELRVETESARTGERTISAASKSTLSVTQACITYEKGDAAGTPGTIITATMQAGKTVNVPEATAYIAQFVAYLPIDVTINGQPSSRRSIEESVQPMTGGWNVNASAVDLGDGFKADVNLAGIITGEVRIALRHIESGGQKLEGQMVLRQGTSSLRTFRSGFGLATTSVSSTYQFGGIADFLFLQPTAGREALTTDSMQLLQRIMSRVDEYVSLQLANRPESNANPHFVGWAAQRQRFDLCSHLRVRIEPGDSLSLQEVRTMSETAPVLVYPGNDQATMKHASEDRPIIIPSRGSPRHDCEMGYLRKYCHIDEVSNEPKVLKRVSDLDLSRAEKALAFRLASVLSSDYFLESKIVFGTISHGLPILIVNRTPPIEIALDPLGATVALILSLYDNEFAAFGHMVKDFVRTMIFPKVSDLVPSATRQGAEAFLKTIHRSREIFEIETNDLESLNALWDDYVSGKVTFQQAVERSDGLIRSHQFIDSSASAPVRDIVPDVISNAATMEQPHDAQFGALPPIQRLDTGTDKKLLTIGDDEPPLKGYRCFLALTDRIQLEKRDFFLQPHRTSVVWGGQKALFIFEHHSGEFGLYYDLQTQSPIHDQSGGGSFETCTIVMKNRVFIPIPEQIKASFLPQGGERRRFEVRCDILYIDQPIVTTDSE